MVEAPPRDGLRGRWSRLGPENKAALAIALVSFLVFLPTVTGDFIFDDIPLISENEWVHSWRWLGRAFTTHFWDVSLYGDAREFRGTDEVVRQYYRPLVTVTYLVNWMLGGGKAWPFHLTNAVLHAITAGFAARVASRWTRSVPLGFACAVVFALHPTRTECVTWISGRTDVMMLLFVFAALESFAAFERRRTAGMRAGRFFVLGILALVAGIASKEPAAMFPLLVLADRATRDPKERSWLVLGVTGAISGTYLLARALFWMPEGSVDHVLTPGHFLITVAAYVERIVLPWPPTMYYHALTADAAGNPVYPKSLLVLGAICVAASLAALVVAWRRRRVAFWLLLASAAFMGPLLNVYFTGMNASAQDRFLYAPLFLLVSGVVVLFQAQVERLARRRVALFAAAAFAVACSLVIQIRTLDFRSNEAFWRAELEQNPSHPYGLEMLAIDAAQRGDLDEAYRLFSLIEQPQSRKYRLAGGTVLARAHFQRAVMLAALLPDGRAGDLAAILDEMWRLVDPSSPPPRAKVVDYEIGTPLAIAPAQRVALEKAFHWDMAFIATRIGDMTRAETIVSRASRELLVVSPNPSNGILALARVGRIAEAREVHAALRERIVQGKSATRGLEEVDSLATQLAEAERAQETRDQAAGPAQRAVAEALRLAGLGAYFAGLRALHDAGLFGAAEHAPLATQLLVACRLDDAARVRAAMYLGEDRARALVDELTAELPERMRAMPAATGSFEDVLVRMNRRAGR